MAKSLKVYWSKATLEDFRLESKYIAEDNPKAAKKFIHQVQHQLKLLKTQPHMGRIGRIPETRELIIKGFCYLVIYRIQNQAIEIVAIFHAARQYPSIDV